MELITLNPADVIIRKGFNPRGADSFKKSDIEMKALMASIEQNGFWSHKPITVRPYEDGYTLIDGHRRCFAAKALGLTEVYAVVEEMLLDETQELLVAIISNEGKRLTPVEEANAYQRLSKGGMTARGIAKAVGRSNPHVSSRLKLLEASPLVQEAVENKEVTVKQLNALIKQFPNDFVSQDEALAELIEEKIQNMKEGVAKRRAAKEAKLAEAIEADKAAALELEREETRKRNGEPTPEPEQLTFEDVQEAEPVAAAAEPTAEPAAELEVEPTAELEAEPTPDTVVELDAVPAAEIEVEPTAMPELDFVPDTPEAEETAQDEWENSRTNWYLTEDGEFVSDSTEEDVVKPASSYKSNAQVVANVHELYDMFVKDYQNCPEDDVKSRFFFAGGIRTLSLALGIDDPFELPM